MTLIKVEQIQKSYGLINVLKDISFSLERGQKVALTGYNGSGKTTLLKILAGVEEFDGGKIEISKDVRLGYLPQDTTLDVEGDTIKSYIQRIAGNDILEHSINTILAGFGFENIDINHKLSDLSSGQRSKVILASIILKGVDLLLLDEPTNNLDLPALIWLENFLQKSDAVCIIISHDRRFLDKVVKKIFEIDWNTHTLNISNGAYSDYLETVAKRLSRQKEEYKSQQEEIARLTNRANEKRADSEAGTHWESSDNDKYIKGFNRDKAGRSGAIAKTIEKKIEQMDKIEKPSERKPFKISLEAEVNPGSLNIRLIDAVMGYVGGFKIGPISLEANYGSRIGIMGLNGSGKSTLLKTLTKEIKIISGKVEVGSGVRIGNMMQEHETLPKNLTLLDFIIEKTGLDQQFSYSELSKFNFNEQQARQKIGELSPGGRARLLLSLFSLQSVNVLVLDEPTNHLDLEALEVLEEILETYKGTIILVSHDRYFLEKAKLDSTYVLGDGNLKRIPDYGVYVEEAEERAGRLLKML
jgi:ATP-binding cassette subfamily F protein 3